MLPTLKRTITKSTLHVIEGTAYLCALHRHITLGAHVTSTLAGFMQASRFVAVLHYCPTLISYGGKSLMSSSRLPFSYRMLVFSDSVNFR